MDGILDFELEFEAEASPKPVLKRSTQLKKAHGKHIQFANNENCAQTVNCDDLSIVKEEINMEDAELWEKSMKDEMGSLDKNKM